MSRSIFKTWFHEPDAPLGMVRVFRERAGARAAVFKQLPRLLAEHFVGDEVVARAGGYKKAADLLKNSLPIGKQTRSGDFGELVATELVDAETSFRVPIRKLRWKSDRKMPMHGNDIIGVDASQTPPRVLKGESKSGVTISSSALDDAVKGLEAFEGRPNPSTLAFIAKRLYEEKRDAEARVFQDLLCEGKLNHSHITHAVLTLAEKDPSALLAKMPAAKQAGTTRMATVVLVAGHGALVAAIFDEAYGAKS
jgi:Cap4 SAVED domain